MRHVRLDDASAAARRRARSALCDEVARLAEDEEDRETMRIIRQQLAELGPESAV